MFEGSLLMAKRNDAHLMALLNELGTKVGYKCANAAGFYSWGGYFAYKTNVHAATVFWGITRFNNCLQNRAVPFNGFRQLPIQIIIGRVPNGLFGFAYIGKALHDITGPVRTVRYSNVGTGNATNLLP